MTTPQRVNKLKAAMQGIQAGDAPQEAAEIVRLPVAAKYPVTPSRVGKRQISGYFTPDAAKQLHLLAVERDTSIQALLEEALNDLFRKFGKSAIV